jgi:hypothetical protein
MTMGKFIICEEILTTLRKRGFTNLGKWELDDVAEQLLREPQLHIGVTGTNYHSVDAFKSLMQANANGISLQSYTQESLQNNKNVFLYADVWIQFMDIHRPISKSDFELYQKLSEQTLLRPIFIIFNDIADLNEEEFAETKVYIEEKITVFERQPYGVLYISLSDEESIRNIVDAVSHAGGGAGQYLSGRYDVLIHLLEQELVLLRSESNQTENQKQDTLGYRYNLIEEIRGLHLYAEGLTAYLNREFNEQQIEGASSIVRALLRRSQVNLNLTPSFLFSLEEVQNKAQLVDNIKEYLRFEIQERRNILLNDTVPKPNRIDDLDRKMNIINEILVEVTTGAQ